MQTGSKNYDSLCDGIIEGMYIAKQAMIKDGLWSDKTTFEEWSQYAWTHCISSGIEEPEEAV